ncbi:MAG TPA: translocation/assembly module TamB domain-containing protein, partial [Candidatus Baltobacteraceae bacterium]
NGSVDVGSTALAFDAAVAPGSVDAALRAPRADLSDFNDYFDTGDTLAGTGSLALSVAMTPFSIASSGDVNLHNVRYRRFDIGQTVANWNTSGRSTSVVASVGGAHGSAHINGTILPASKTIAMNASARNIDLNNWLPLLGYTTPVTGYIDADAVLRGRYPAIAMNAHANLRDGTVGRVHIERASIAADALNGRGHITQAVVQIPYLLAQGSGTFGLHRGDPLALGIHATSPDVGKLMQTFSGKPNQIAGALDTTAHVTGTASDPRVNDSLALTQVRYAKMTVPKVQAKINVDKRRVALTQGVVTLAKGTVSANGNVPLRASAGAPIALTLAANGVNLSDFSAMLPHGTKLAGALNGALHVGGSMRSPMLTGSMALRNGYFVGPIDQNPISAMNADMLFSGTTIALNNVHANVGGGKLTMNGTASVPTLRDIKAVTFDSTIVADNAQVNSPQYFRGKFNANIHAFRPKGGIPTIAGTVDIPSARVPLTAFWNPHAPKTPAHAPIPLGFDMKATVGHDVRIQSPNVDVGAQGAVTVLGTLAHPMLQGTVASTGGTVDFLRRFDIQQAIVAFDPSNGFWPTIDAIAGTQVNNPLTYIQMHVTGLAPNEMHLGLLSDPSYSRAQILALLAGFGSSGNSTGGFTLAGAAQNVALGQVNTLLTRDLFEPLDVGLGNALGLQNLQLTDDFTSGFGINAVKAFGKHVTAVFAENLGEPKEQSLSIEAHHGPSTAFDLMLYSVQDPPLTGFLSQTTNPFKFNSINGGSAMTAVSGTNGISLLYEKKFH